jgi:subtilisin
MGGVRKKRFRTTQERAMIFQKAYLAGTIALCSIAGATSASADLRQRGADMASPFSACPDSAAAPQTIATPCLAIARFDTVTTAAERRAFVQQSGAVLRFNYAVVNAASVLIPNARSYQALASHPRVVRLMPDRPVQALAPPSCQPWPACKNDSGGSSSQIVPAGIRRIGADRVWAGFSDGSCCTGAGVTVAILDTGLDSSHPDLAGNFKGGATCLGTSDSAVCVEDGGKDDEGHGTHVGGIVAAKNNNSDVVGVAPDAGVYSVKVLDSTGTGWDSNIIAGLDWVATQTTAQVVNMSLGRTGNCLDDNSDPSGALIRNTLQVLKEQKNISVVVAAVNDYTKEVKVMVPAGCPAVMAVASTTAQDGNNKCKVLPGRIYADTASFFTTDGALDSNGVGVTISAPGETREDNSCASIQSVGIDSLAMGGGITKKSGTSMAAPHVAGVAALMLQANPQLCPDGIRDIIRQYAQGVGSAPYDHPYINESVDGQLEGIVDAYAVIGRNASACPSS